MLTKLHIQSFRGLQDFHLEDLRPINVLVGENNSGKTSVLEAMMAFLAPGSLRTWSYLLYARDPDGDISNLGRLASWLFPVVGRDSMDERRDISIDGVWFGDSEKLTMNYRKDEEMMEAGRRRNQEGGWDEVLTSVSIAKVSASFFSSEGEKSGELRFIPRTRERRVFEPIKVEGGIERMPRRPVEYVKPHAHRSRGYSANSISEAVRRGLKEVLLGFLQIFDSEISEIDVIEDSTVIIQHRTLGPLPLHAFGDGLRKALVVAGHAFRVPGGVLLVDEAESALHVTCQRDFFTALFKLCESLQVQVFLTTHSLDAVDGIIQACSNPESLVGFHLPDRNSGQTVKRMSGDIMERLRFERGLDLR